MPAAQRNRIRKNDPEGLRRRVLDVAAGLFQTTGYGGASMHDVMREAAVTGGALHHHFPSKKHLALAVITERVRPEVADTWIARVRGAPSAAAGIVAVFDEVATGLEAKGAVSGCPLTNLALELALTDEDFRIAIEGEYATWREAVADRLRLDIVEGRAAFAADDAAAFADVVVSMFAGAMALAKADQRATALRSCAAWLRRWMALDL